MTSLTMPRRIAVGALCAGVGLAACSQPPGAGSAAGEGERAPVACDSLADLALPGAKVTLAQRVAPGAFKAPPPPPGPPVEVDYGALPAFCRVAATAAPTPDSVIKFEVWLPVEGWNGKLVTVGNGGFSGAIWYFEMARPLMRGYAVAGSDTGHEGGPADISFAVGHPEKLVDFAWRAVHETTVKGKAIVAANYAKPASRSYWVGCSTGGRQGLKAAQRFPDDFDGIAAGAPANNWVPLMAYGAQVQRVLTDPAVGLAPPQLAMLKEAAIAACDARDDVTDRVVEDPRSCTFDPGTLACTAGKSSGCLTPRQVEAARSLYGGVVSPRTKEKILPGPAPGGELQWQAYAPGVFPIADNYWRDYVMADPAWTVAKLDVDADVARGKTVDTAEVAATDPNLKPFVASGGKLLLWHGWTDGLIPAQNTIDYYESALAATGADQSKDSVRLFMVPGVDHCSGGEGTFVVDALGVIDTWVESGKPPERIVARRPLDGGAVRTRPLCPYPQVARYRGQGSTDDASNFACMPEPTRR
ncbi:MAG: tannase/feruloyl esterase family alpha/beta hydrolase [Vicinamibacterales bacterium]